MSGLRRKLAWLPSFLLGAVGASTGVLAGALLLYTGQGFLRSLTVILATELLGLGLGLATSRSVVPGDLGGVRRRWLVALLAYAGAAAFAAAWSLGSGFAAAAWAQGLGLGLVGGFPLFAVGAVLAGLPAAGDDGRGLGAAAVLGAVLGVVATGLAGMPRFEPPSILLFCVVAVSVGALVHGWQVDGRVVSAVASEDRGDGEGPVLRVEERVRSGPGRTATVVTVDRRPAVGMVEDGEPLLAWERTAARLAREVLAGGGSALLVGAGPGGVSRSLDRAPERGELVVFEPWDRMRRLQWDGVGTGNSQRPARRAEGWAQAEAFAPFRAVVVSLRLLPGGGPFPGRGLAALEASVSALASGGLLLLGGVEPTDDDGGVGTLRWIAARSWSPDRLILLRPSAKEPAEEMLLEEEGTGGGLIVGGVPEELDGDDPAWQGEMERVAASSGGAVSPGFRRGGGAERGERGRP